MRVCAYVASKALHTPSAILTSAYDVISSFCNCLVKCESVCTQTTRMYMASARLGLHNYYLLTQSFIIKKS